MNLVIVETGGANLTSLVAAFERLELTPLLTSDGEVIRSASHVVLPGVGTAFDAMERLKRKNLVNVLINLTQPVLGICLGMQILYEESTEFSDASSLQKVKCLEIIAGTVTKIKYAPSFPVPHMGWNTLSAKPDSVFSELNGNDFYFTHSYLCPDGPSILASVDYSVVVPAICVKNNFWGVQFHPEKSAGSGSLLLKRFLSQ